MGTTRYNLFYIGTTFANSFGKYSETLKILSIMASIQRTEKHLTSLGKNGTYNEYAAETMKMTRNNVNEITMFPACLDQGRSGAVSILFNHLVQANTWV